MPVVAVAVCPHPPLLVPEIAGAAARELDELRAACDEAVRRLLSAGTSAIVVVSGAPDTRRYPAGSHGDFGNFGAPGVRVGFGRHKYAGAGQMPLGQLVGAWLLLRTGGDCPRFGQAVADRTLPDQCAELGRELGVSDPPIGLLVMGDGSARRTDKAPGHFHPGAESFDAAVATALGTADTAALRSLDPGLAAELMVAGRAPWQVLAGAAGEAAWRPELLYDAAPYGVGYFVASWTR